MHAPARQTRPDHDRLEVAAELPALWLVRREGLAEDVRLDPGVGVVLRFSGWWSSLNWDRFLLSTCIAFHALVAIVLGALGDYVWAAVFAVAAVAAGLLLWRVTAGTLLLTAYTVGPLGVTWLGALAVGLAGEDLSVPGLIAWPFLYLPWSVVAIRLALGER